MSSCDANFLRYTEFSEFITGGKTQRVIRHSARWQREVYYLDNMGLPYFPSFSEHVTTLLAWLDAWQLKAPRDGAEQDDPGRVNEHVAERPPDYLAVASAGDAH